MNRPSDTPTRETADLLASHRRRGAESLEVGHDMHPLAEADCFA